MGKPQDRVKDVEYSDERRSRMKVKVRWLYKVSLFKSLEVPVGLNVFSSSIFVQIYYGRQVISKF